MELLSFSKTHYSSHIKLRISYDVTSELHELPTVKAYRYTIPQIQGPSLTLMSNNSLDASKCFVCGPENNIGLKLKFRLDGDICRSEFTPKVEHCGYDDVTHGGIIFSVLDDVMANWIYLKGIRAYTAKCDIRYKDNLKIGTKVNVEGQCIKRRNRLILMEGKMVREDTGDTVAETQASFMIDNT